MSERLTSIDLHGFFGYGWAEWGRKTVPEMIAIFREKAARDKAAAEAILSAPDADFCVTTYVGPHAMRKLETLQEGKARVKG